MNWFKEKVKELNSEINRVEEETIKFSKKLQKATGLTEKEVIFAAENNVTWPLGDYVLKSIKTFCTNDKEWKSLLMAIPTMRTVFEFKECEGGTTHCICPINDETCEKILSLVKEKL